VAPAARLSTAMRKKTRSLLFLALGTALLGGAVYLQIARERAAFPPPLTDIDPARVTRLEVRCSAVCRTRRFERDGTTWRMLEPYAAPANAEMVAKLLSVARAPVSVKLDAAAYDMAKLGLAPPLVTLRVDDVEIALGDEDPIDHDRYVRVGKLLARVPDRFSARVFETPESELAVAPAKE